MMAVTPTMIIFASLSLLFAMASCRTLFGGVTAINDVKANKEVQELGMFAVEKYNRGLKQWKSANADGSGEKLEFGEVVEAHRQVVSGTKYYMEISATESGVQKMYTSVVVVKPWLHSKQLLNFGPSSSSSSAQ